MQTLDLELFRIYLPADLWHAGPTLGLCLPDVDFHSRMEYPYWMFPYLLDAGLSGTRLAALLATSPQLRHLTLESRALYDLPKDFLAHNPRLQILSVAFGDFNKYNIYSEQYVQLPAGLLAHNPDLDN